VGAFLENNSSELDMSHIPLVLAFLHFIPLPDVAGRIAFYYEEEPVGNTATIQWIVRATDRCSLTPRTILFLPG
jgi:hypothetical protein